MKRSLFIKIFLWFWLAMAVVLAVLFIAVATTQSEPLLGVQRVIVEDATRGYAAGAAKAYRAGGTGALRSYLQQLDGRASIQALVVDPRGDPLAAGDPVDPAVVAAVHRLSAAAPAKGVHLQAVGRYVVASCSVPPPGEGVFAAAMVRPILSAAGLHRSAHLVRLLAVILAGGLVCYRLARHLVSPVVKLRQATRRFADGDLSARVGTTTWERGDELAELCRDFDRMADRIQALLLAQRRLLGNISHELRSPLARLNVALELARRQSGPDSSRALDRIGREAARLEGLVDQLLTLTRLESGQSVLDRATVDLGALVRDVAADADFEARSHDRSVHVLEAQPCTVNGDIRLLRSAVENVIRNAIQYTAGGTAVEVTLRCEPGESGGCAMIEVRDHGPGVPDAALPELFRPFYRVADARDRQTGGAGLGLAIADRAVRSHGGAAAAQNTPGGGLCVQLRVPVNP